MIPDTPPEPLRSGLALAIVSARSALDSLQSALEDWEALHGALESPETAISELASVWYAGFAFCRDAAALVGVRVSAVVDS